MKENLYFIYWIFFLIFWIFTLRVFKFKILELSIPGIVISIIILVNYIGFPILFYDLNHFRTSQISDKDLIYQVWFYSSIHITLFIFGIVTGIIFLGKLKFKNIQNIKFFKLKKNQKIFLILSSLFCILFYFGYFQKIGFDQIAILNLFKSKEELLNLRSIMGPEFDGDFFYNFFGKTLLGFVFIVLLTNYLISKNPYDLIFLILIGFFYLFFLTASTEKYQYVRYFLQIYFVWVVVRMDRKIKVFNLIGFLFVFFIIIIFTYYYFMDKTSIFSSLLSGLDRIFLGNIIAGIYYYEYFPKIEGFLYGKSFPNPGGILPFGGYSLSRELYFYFNSFFVIL